MSDDILTQLQNDIAFRLRLQAKVSNLYEIQHPHMVRVPTIYEEAADEIEYLRADRDRWAKWGEHVFTCPNKGLNPCRECVSPATADAMNRVDEGGTW